MQNICIACLETFQQSWYSIGIGIVQYSKCFVQYSIGIVYYVLMKYSFRCYKFNFVYVKEPNFLDITKKQSKPLIHGTLCQGLNKTIFRPKFRLKPKSILCFRFLLDRNRKRRNRFRFPFKGKGISAERKILAENFGFLCSLYQGCPTWGGMGGDYKP